MKMKDKGKSAMPDSRVSGFISHPSKEPRLLSARSLSRLGLVLFLCMFDVLFLSLSRGVAAEPTGYFKSQTLTLSDGTLLTKAIIGGPVTQASGYQLQRTAAALPEANQAQGTNILTVPAYNLVFGSAAVSGAMIAGYYDRNGYPNIYIGPTNGGVMPLDNSSWPTWSDGVAVYPNLPLAASHNGVDGRATSGSIDDYWVQYGSSASDPYITGSWTQHIWGEAIGDYMKTSQSAYGNIDGATTFYNYTSVATPLTCADMATYGVDFVDGTYGLKLFYEARGYTVTACYSQNTDNTISGGFSFAQFKAEIDAGRPVMLQLTGTTIVGVGYDDTNSTVFVHDTADYGTYPMIWGGSYYGMQLLSVSIVNLLSVATPTSTGVTSASNPSVSGQSVTFTATVTPTPGSGTVTFKAGGVGIAGCIGSPLSGAQSTCTTSSLAVGNHTITAAYSGDASFAASTGSLTGNPQVVNQAPTTAVLVSAPNPSVFGQSVTLTATVTAVAPGAGTPGGTVNFFDGAASLGSGTLSGGVATLNTSSLSVGPHSITAVYAGDTNFTGSTSPASMQTVSQISTTTAVTPTPTPSVFGQSVILTATVTAVPPGAGTPGGTVNFFDGAASLGSGTLSGGVATLNTASLSVGPHTVTAVYPGDTNYAGSTSTNVNQVVNQASTTTALSPSVNPSGAGQSVIFTATISAVAPGAGTPGGTVNFFDGAASLGSGTLSGGVATLNTSSLSVGPHVITAVYAGDTNFTGSTSALVNQVVNQASTTTALSPSVNPSGFGQSVVFTATVSVVVPATGTPTGMVTFYDGAAALGTATLNGSAVAIFSTAALTAGPHPVTAVYAGDAAFGGSLSAAVNQVVNQASVTIAVGSSANPSTTGQGITITVTVSAAAPAAGTPTGMVTFYDGMAILGTVALNSSGVATFTTGGLSAGTHAITVSYTGDPNFGAGTSSVMTQMVNAAAPPIAVPTLSEWGMLLYLLLTGVGSLYYLRRQGSTH